MGLDYLVFSLHNFMVFLESKLKLLMCVIAGVYRIYLHIKHQENIFFKSYCSITVCDAFKHIVLMFLYEILRRIFNEH